MKSKIFLLVIVSALCILIFYCCSKTCYQRNNCETLQADAITKQWIVKFYDSTEIADIQAAMEKLRNTYHAKVIDSCGCDPRLKLIEVTSLTPNDSVPPADDNIHPQGIMGQNYVIFSDSSVAANDTGNLNTASEGSGIIIAVIDGGINKTDRELANKFWVNPQPNDDCLPNALNGYDFVKKRGSVVGEIIPHGTDVSKIIVKNVCDNVNIQLMDLRVFDSSGNGTLFHGLCALSFAIKHGAKIVNMSWGYYKTEMGRSEEIFTDYIRVARDSCMTLVASAGNDTVNTDYCLHFPSGFYAGSYKLGNVISVAALGKDENKLADYSNYGEKTVGIAAKGTYDDIDQIPIYGTSYSAPVVTAAAANLYAKNDTICATEIVNSLKENTSSIKSCHPIDKGGLKNTATQCQ